PRASSAALRGPLSMLPLAGVTMLDFSWGEGPAAACGRLLTQLGARLQTHDGRRRTARIPELAAAADVVLTDLRPAEARHLGLDVAELSGSGRVVVSVTPFGLDGPDAGRADEAAACAGM